MIKRLIWKLVSFRGPEFTHCFSYFVTHGLQHTRICKTLNFLGRTDAEAEAPALWPPHVKSWLIGKDSDAGRDWGQEEKGTTEDEMAGWHHRLDGQEFDWTLGVGDGQGGLACCDSWGRKDWATELNWTDCLISNIFQCLFGDIFIYSFWWCSRFTIYVFNSL